LAVSFFVSLGVAVSDTRAASTPISTAQPIGEFVTSDGVPVHDVLARGADGRDEAVAEQIFQTEFASARSVASFARDAKPLGLLAQDGLTSSFPAAGIESGPMGLSGRGLFNTISALHGPGATPVWSADSDTDHGATAKSSSDHALAQFWERTASSGALSAGLSESSTSAAAGPGPSNVLIPLPAAAWSALSVLSGMGVMSVIRRQFRRRA
jgi:hypothetical protein